MAKRLTWPRLLGLALDAAKGMLYLRKFFLRGAGV
jgi:hypothetical protein